MRQGLRRFLTIQGLLPLRSETEWPSLRIIMLYIILKYSDDSIAIRGHLTPSYLASHSGDRTAALNELMTERVPVQNPDAVATLIDVTLPEKDYLRNSWTFDGSNVVHDMTKARAIHLAEIRRVRNEELVKEDVTFMRAVEAEDTDAQATIKTKKQTLRDIPATFDITTDVDTPEKLKAKWPTELPARE